MKYLGVITLLVIISITGIILLPRLSSQDAAIITFTFDDGYKEHYEAALPLFEKYGAKAVDYIIAGKIDSEFEGTPTMNLNEIQALQNAGWEIGSHSLSHPFLTKLTKTELEKELKESKKILTGKGFVVKSISIPYGDFNAEVKEEAKQYYNSMRTSEEGYNSRSDPDKYELKSIAVSNETTLIEMKSWVDSAKRNKQWLIIMLHLVREEKSSKYSKYGISPSDLDELIKYIRERGIRIKTVSEVLDEEA